MTASLVSSVLLVRSDFVVVVVPLFVMILIVPCCSLLQMILLFVIGLCSLSFVIVVVSFW